MDWKNRLKNLGSGMGAAASAGNIIRNMDAAKDWVEARFADPAQRGSSGEARKAEEKRREQEKNTPAGGGAPAASSFGDFGGGGVVDPDAAQVAELRSRIGGRGDEIERIYNLLFGDLTKLLKSRSGELEEQYGEQLKNASDTYVTAIPQIETSYAALGASDSTDQSDAKTGAKKGFDETTATIGKNKEKDQAALGQYGREQRARFKADQDAAKRAIESSASTTDVDALRGLDNDLASNMSQAGVTRATLGTDGAARKELSGMTADNGRYDAAINALDGILKSSMSGAVKAAAVEAITSAGGLSDVEKKKVQQTYGNTYAEQAAL